MPVRAAVGLVETRSGTSVTLRCAYDESENATKQEYSLYAVAHSGESESIGSWSVGPGDEYTTTTGTRFKRSDIKSLEIRRTDGNKPVLRADL